MLHETAPSQGLSDGLSLIGDLSAQNVVLFYQIGESRLQSLDFLILLNDSLNNVGSIHALSHESALSLRGVWVSFGQFFESGL